MRRDGGAKAAERENQDVRLLHFLQQSREPCVEVRSVPVGITALFIRKKGDFDGKKGAVIFQPTYRPSHAGREECNSE